MSLSIIVLAAGKGSRMNSSIPKVFHQVGNKSMISHVHDVALSMNPKLITTVISDDLESLSREKKNKKIKFVIQRSRNGTADAVKIALKKNNSSNIKNTLILYGDTPLVEGKTIKNALKYFIKKSLDLCVLAMSPQANEHAYGRLFFNNKSLVKIVEKTEMTKAQLENDLNICNSGMMIFNTKKLLKYIEKVKNLNIKKEFYLTDLINIFHKNSLKSDYYLCDYEQCRGVNNMKELSNANKIFQDMRRNFFLNKGVFMEDPSTVFFSADTSIEKDVKIQPNVYFGVGVTVKSNVLIKSFTHLENTIVNRNVTLGPFSRIRDNVEIGSDAKIGNFVEIKKSDIKKGVKISHLSYVGDAFIGKETNIGAGSITCNFDGKNKNRTIIGSDCFIGSNTSLIAPLQIKKNSVIGAGTTVNKNIKENSLIYRKSELVRKEKKK